MRVFDPSGRQLREIKLETPAVAGLATYPPDPTITIDKLVWRIVPVAGSRLLVEWRYSERTGNSQRNSRYMCLHDMQGKALSAPSLPPADTAVLFSDDAGYAYMLRRTGKLIRIRLGLQ